MSLLDVSQVEKLPDLDFMFSSLYDKSNSAGRSPDVLPKTQPRASFVENNSESRLLLNVKLTLES